MTEVKKLLKDLTERYESDLSLVKSVIFVSFKHDTETIKGFLTTFNQAEFKEVAPLVYMSKTLEQENINLLRNELEEYAKKVYEYIPDSELDHFNKSIEAGKTNMGSIEVVVDELKDQKIEQFYKMKSYEKDLEVYYSKLLSKDAASGYIKEMTEHLKMITNHSMLKDDKTLDTLVRDIYELAKKIADKNVFDFGFLENHSVVVQMAIQSHSSLLKKENGSLDLDSSYALMQTYDLHSRGFDVSKIADIIRASYPNVDNLEAIKTEKEIKPLEDNLQYRYISSNSTNLGNGFTFSKGRVTVSDKNLFEIVVSEVSKAAVNEVKIKRSSELYNDLKAFSKNKKHFEITQHIKTYMNTDKFNMKDNWETQLKLSTEPVKKLKTKKKPKNQ